MPSIAPLDVRFELQNIHSFDDAESDGAEPYLWTVFFKIDGDTVSVNLTKVDRELKAKLNGSALVVGKPGNQGNLLNAEVNPNQNAGIPAAIGQFQTTLNPILLDGDTNFAVMGGYVGCVAVLMEEDNTPNSSVAKGHAALNAAMQKVLNGLIVQIDAIISSKKLGDFLNKEDTIKEEIAALIKTQTAGMTEQVKSEVFNTIANDLTIWDVVSGLGDIDDLLGIYVGYFSHDELANVSVLPIGQRWQPKAHGDWELTGQIVVPGWKGWFSLGGQIKDAPAVIGPTPETIDIYARGTDDRLWQKWWTGSEWLPSDVDWEPHDDGGFRLDSAPSVVGNGQNFREVFVRGKNGAVFHKFWNGSEWSDWFSLGGQIKGAPCVVIPSPGLLDVYARGTDDRLWQKWWTGSEWLPSVDDWKPHDDGGFRLGSAPSVLAFGPNFRDIFVRGQNGGVFHKVWDGTKWSGWFALGGEIQGSPSCVMPSLTTEDLYVRGTDNGLWQKWWTGSAWEPSVVDWIDHDDGFVLGSSPAVIADGPNFRDIYARGQDGRVYHKIWLG